MKTNKRDAKELLLTRKTPRDFVFIDEFWEADDNWQEYYLNQCVWVYMDEYRAELPGDEDYSRIIIHSGNERGWKYSKRLKDRELVHAVMASIQKPVSELNLIHLGFEPWNAPLSPIYN